MGLRRSCSIKLIMDCERPACSASLVMESRWLLRSSRRIRATWEQTLSRNSFADTHQNYQKKNLTV